MRNTPQNKLFDFNLTTLIVGMGGTGLSCARYLQTQNCQFAIADSRAEPNNLTVVKNEFPEIEIFTGIFDLEVFKHYQQIIVSPGVSIRSNLFNSLAEQGCFILGDIELFAQVVDKPVIAITGSNGKSTVTTLVEKIANECGIKTIAGGNLGIPALDLLSSNSDLYVLELSSFQLETTYSLQTLSATVLNISEDHMDRYRDLDDYRQVKETIYDNTDYAIVNYDEQKIFSNIKKQCLELDKEILLFGYGLGNKENLMDCSYPLFYLQDNKFLYHDKQFIMTAQDIKIKGTFNYLNVLAALALLVPLQLDKNKQYRVIKQYNGLEHRCEWVSDIEHISFYNDSKGTNTGATIAAIQAFDELEQVILIAGGVGKGANFDDLGEVISNKVKATILLGTDADKIKNSALKLGAKKESFYPVTTMSEAVFVAKSLAQIGDVILFSPACASFDRYQNYMQRGDDFKKCVLSLQEEIKHVS